MNKEEALSIPGVEQPSAPDSLDAVDRSFLMGVDYGYRLAERGMNIQAAMIEAHEILRETNRPSSAEQTADEASGTNT